MRANPKKRFCIKKIAGIGCFLLLLATNGLHAQSVSIDTGIKNSAAYFEQQLQNNIAIAVINVNSDSLALSEYIINELSLYFVNGKNFTVVDRKNLDAIQQEVNYQLSGEVSDRTAQSIGQKIGAQSIILGSIQPFVNEFRLDLRALSVETGVIQGIYRQDIKNDSRLKAVLGGNELLLSGTWKNNWLYLGLGVGGGFLPAMMYSDSDTSSSSYYDFHGGFSITGQITDIFGIQTGLIYSLDMAFGEEKISEEIGYISAKLYQNKLTIPLLAAFSLMPQNFLFGGLGGLYFSFPFGNMGFSHTIANINWTFTYTPISPSVGLMLGAYFGYHIGPGVLRLDIRYLNDLKGTEYEMSATDRMSGTTLKSGNTTDLWSIFRFSAGYEIGILKKK